MTEYQRLKTKAINTESFEDCLELARWFDRHQTGWNGEYYDLDDGYIMIPVYDFDPEDPDGDFTLVDFEIRYF